MKGNILVMVGKQPIEGHCKTRLAKTVGHAFATGLYACFLSDLRDRLSSDLATDCDFAIAYSPESDAAYFDTFCGDSTWQRLPQYGDDLGVRLNGLLEYFLAAGYQRVVVMSSDSPDLPTEYIQSAFQKLTEADAVLGPCADGGYYLIGSRRSVPELFVDITWSTEVVTTQTINRARAAGIVLPLLPDWYDIDTEDDLRGLIERTYTSSTTDGVYAGSIPNSIEYMQVHFNNSDAFIASLLKQAPPVRRKTFAQIRWQTQSSRAIYKNPWTDVREDIVELPNGKTALYGVVTFAECVGVLPMLDNGRVVLTRQYRYVAGDFFWEIPTGGMKPGETPAIAATRELREEIGYRATHLVPLQSFHTSKSVCRETAHLFIATGLQPDALVPDDTEFFHIQDFAFDEAFSMVERGIIADSMSVIALYAAHAKHSYIHLST